MPELLEDLCGFCNRLDLPPAIQAAIAHVQFETIHPFFDGNGRVGRALILIILRRRGVAKSYLPPVSLVLAGEADRYVPGWGAGAAARKMTGTASSSTRCFEPRAALVNSPPTWRSCSSAGWSGRGIHAKAQGRAA